MTAPLDNPSKWIEDIVRASHGSILAILQGVIDKIRSQDKKYSAGQLADVAEFLAWETGRITMQSNPSELANFLGMMITKITSGFSRGSGVPVFLNLGTMGCPVPGMFPAFPTNVKHGVRAINLDVSKLQPDPRSTKPAKKPAGVEKDGVPAPDV